MWWWLSTIDRAETNKRTYLCPSRTVNFHYEISLWKVVVCLIKWHMSNPSASDWHTICLKCMAMPDIGVRKCGKYVVFLTHTHTNFIGCFLVDSFEFIVRMEWVNCMQYNYHSQFLYTWIPNIYSWLKIDSPSIISIRLNEWFSSWKKCLCGTLSFPSRFGGALRTAHAVTMDDHHHRALYLISALNISQKSEKICMTFNINGIRNKLKCSVRKYDI